MNRPTSLYLDLVRFLAAFMVFADHGSGQMISGGFMWQFAPYGPEAVTVFFVLSGFVIAYATDARETAFRDYAVARAARIYSVAIPALVLTAVADAYARSISTALYTEALHYHAGGQIWRFLASSVFLNELWGLHLSPGSNWSYWSLGYEVWYYIIFAAAVFLHGRMRVLSLAALLLVAGPAICAMLPLWLLGVWIYRLCRKDVVGPWLGMGLLVASLGLWAGYEAVAWHSGRWLISDAGFLAIFKRAELAQDYIVAVGFAGSLVGFHGLSKWLEPYAQGSWSVLRWAAGGTFSLYLFHEPLLRLLATLNPYAPTSWAGRGVVLGGTLVCVFIAAEFTERRKAFWRRLFSALADAIARLGWRRLETRST